MLVSSMKYLKTYRSKVLEPEVFHLNPGKSDNLKFRNFVRYGILIFVRKVFQGEYGSYIVFILIVYIMPYTLIKQII